MLSLSLKSVGRDQRWMERIQENHMRREDDKEKGREVVESMGKPSPHSQPQDHVNPTQGSHNHLHLLVLCVLSCSHPNQMQRTHSALFLVQPLIVEQSGLMLSPLLPYACLILSLHRIKLIICIAGQPASKEECRNAWELTCVKSA